MSISIPQEDKVLDDKDLADAWLVFDGLRINRADLTEESVETFDKLLGNFLRMECIGFEPRDDLTIVSYDSKFVGNNQDGYVFREKNSGVTFQVNPRVCATIGGGLRDIEQYDS